MVRAWCGGAPPTPADRCGGCSRPGPAPRRRCHSSRTPRQARARAAARCGRHRLCRSLTASPEPCTASGLYQISLVHICPSIAWFAAFQEERRNSVVFYVIPNIKTGNRGGYVFKWQVMFSKTAHSFCLFAFGSRVIHILYMGLIYMFGSLLHSYFKQQNRKGKQNQAAK